jgi:hypothetical protein
MDRAYEGDETRDLAVKLGYIPVVPPKTNRLRPWEYDRVMYRRRNEIERLFRRLKGFRRVFSRFDKLDVMFAGFVLFALIVDALRFSVNTPKDKPCATWNRLRHPELPLKSSGGGETPRSGHLQNMERFSQSPRLIWRGQPTLNQYHQTYEIYSAYINRQRVARYHRMYFPRRPGS